MLFFCQVLSFVHLTATRVHSIGTLLLATARLAMRSQSFLSFHRFAMSLTRSDFPIFLFCSLSSELLSLLGTIVIRTQILMVCYLPISTSRTLHCCFS